MVFGVYHIVVSVPEGLDIHRDWNLLKYSYFPTSCNCELSEPRGLKPGKNKHKNQLWRNRVKFRLGQMLRYQITDDVACKNIQEL